jgi:hypothetical protein
VEGFSTTDALDVLQLAREHIRSRTRSRTYLEHADRFAAAYLGKTLGVAPEYYKAVGTEATIVIDAWYEHLVAEGETAAPMLKQTTRRLQEMLDPAAAVRTLPALRARLEVPSCTLLEVACGNLAAITSLGHASLSARISNEVAEVWLALWQSSAWNHNHQQELHCGLSMLPPLSADARIAVMATLEISPADLRPGGTTFSSGAREYLAIFSESGAAAMALVGALPFAERVSSEDLSALIAFLTATPELPALLCRILRLAQDVSFDPSEPVSTGVVALAAERGVSIVDLHAAQLPKAALDAQLREEWSVYSHECRRQMDAILAALPADGALRRVLAEIVATTCLVAEALTSAAYKA